MKKQKSYFITEAAIIAALYVVLTLAINAINLASGAIQVRISEALTILPYFTPAAVPGLTIGCLISNLIAGASGVMNIFDVIFGTIATLLGAYGSYALRKHKWLVPLPPIISNTLIIPWILHLAYGIPGGVPFFMVTIGIGEILSCGILGMALLTVLQKYRNVIWKS